MYLWCCVRLVTGSIPTIVSHLGGPSWTQRVDGPS